MMKMTSAIFNHMSASFQACFSAVGVPRSGVHDKLGYHGVVILPQLYGTFRNWRRPLHARSQPSPIAVLAGHEEGQRNGVAFTPLGLLILRFCCGARDLPRDWS